MKQSIQRILHADINAAAAAGEAETMLLLMTPSMSGSDVIPGCRGDKKHHHDSSTSWH
jgi:hypothetical protein